jgi:hypothetical protein
MTKAGTVKAGGPGSTNMQRRRKEGREKGESTREEPKLSLFVSVYQLMEGGVGWYVTVKEYSEACVKQGVYRESSIKQPPLRIRSVKKPFSLLLLDTLCRGC